MNANHCYKKTYVRITILGPSFHQNGETYNDPDGERPTSAAVFFDCSKQAFERYLTTNS
jgi:hypothetical protein